MRRPELVPEQTFHEHEFPARCPGSSATPDAYRSPWKKNVAPPLLCNDIRSGGFGSDNRRLHHSYFHEKRYGSYGESCSYCSRWLASLCGPVAW